MESNSMEQATQAMEIAEEKLVTGHDLSEAMKLALNARRLYPELKGIDQLISVLEVHLAAAADPNDCIGNRDYYKILQVDPQADSSMIKKQYRKIALNVHPDKNHSIGAAEAFKMVIEAFEVLSDERKRELYDRGLWRRMKQAEEGWKKGKTQKSEEDIQNSRRKMREGIEEMREKRRSQMSEEIERARMKIRKQKEEWEKKRAQMSQEDIEKARRRMQKAQEEMVKNENGEDID